MSIPFNNTYANLPERFYRKQAPAQVPSPSLITANAELATQLGIDPDWLKSDEALAAFSGNQVPQGAEPLAQAYAGHQFGGFSPQLGDGRALLLGEVIDTAGARKDIQLKGSGRTYFSRGGDGKSALGPVLREYLVSEAMHAFGVPTTRALAAVTTGEEVLRQEGHLPGGIFTRVASSHLRIGTFQYFLAQNDPEAIAILADFAIERHCPEAAQAANPPLALLESVLKAQATLVAQWMSFGFIHGVMNTDNSSISGETIDYGPCAFMDDFHPMCVFSSIDSGARYAWGNQPQMALWNLTRFAETLLVLIDENQDAAIAQAETVLSTFTDRFGQAYFARFYAKLGLPKNAPSDFVETTLKLMAKHSLDFTVFFRVLTQVAGGQGESGFLALFDKPDEADTADAADDAEEWLVSWRSATSDAPDVDAMRQANPIFIPRNHRIEQAIEAGNRGDFDIFYRLNQAFKHPFTESAENADLEVPPLPEEVVHQTFCGT